MVDLTNIKPASVYMTAGRDYNSASGYEFLIGAYEVEPTHRARDGSAFPVTLHRESGFRNNAAAKRAGIAWARANGVA